MSHKLLKIGLAASMLLSTCQEVLLVKANQSLFPDRVSTFDLSSEDAFYEDFGDLEEETIDTQIWHHQVDTSTVMKRAKDPESTDAQNGKGYCFYTDGTNKSFIEHTFSSLIRGKVSVDFYDDGTNQTGRMAQVNLTGIANDNNGGKPFTIGLGINQNTATSGWSNDHYVARIADDGRYMDTGIPRTKGWHTFVLECTEEGTSLSIDGRSIDVSSIPASDLVTSFQNIQIGDKWGKGGETYFDNITLENMTIVDWEQEEEEKHDAGLAMIQIDGFDLPGFSSDQLEYTYMISDLTKVPTVTAQANNEKAKVQITQASEEELKAFIDVTAADGETSQQYQITFVEATEIESEWKTSFEESNPMDLWETLDSRGTYTEITSEQAHDGTHSFVTRGTAETKSWIFKKYDQPINGKMSVWFYDTMGENGKESYQQVNVWAPFENVNEQPAITGIGTQSGNATYSIRTPGNGYASSQIQRTKGWHQFTFDLTSGNGAVFYIDDVKVYETSEVTSIGALQMGDIWSTSGATAYYDDVSITEIQPAVTGIALNKKQLTLESGTSEQLEAKIFPLNAVSDVKWQSSKPEIASVDENGNVTAGTRLGSATITAESEKGKFSAVCEVNVTVAPTQDASLKEIYVDDELLEDFSLDQLNYELTIVDDQIPTIRATATQDQATVKIKNATAIPGTTIIEVTAPDGKTMQEYTIQLNPLEDVFFDDFSYADAEELEKKGNWDVQEGTGRRPGNRSWYWSADNVELIEDSEDPDNTIVRLKAKTDGTGGENTSQSQIRYYEEKFGPGVYVAKVWLYDDVMEADGEKGTGAWNAQDQALSTFFTINRIQAPTWEPYHESDFEYLFNGGWGGPDKTMWFTTWNSYALESSSEAQRNQVTTSNHEQKSLDGKWSILTIQIDEDGRTTYYIDGEKKASHANKDDVVGPQSIAFNLWFIGGGQDKKVQGERTYWEDVDWIYYTPDTKADTAQIEEIVADMKEAGIDAFDEIETPDVTLSSISVDGKPLQDFDPNQTDYTIELPEGTSEVPTISAEASSEWAIIDITNATSLPGTSTIYVQSSDLSVAKTYHITFKEKGKKDLIAPLSNHASGSSAKYRDIELYALDSNAEIYYTLDGSTPTKASAKYEGTPICIEKSTNLKAVAYVGDQKSAVADFIYTVIPITPQVSMHPQANLKSGTYKGTQYLELTVPESNQRFYEVEGRTDFYKIYYTTDGTIPTVNQYKPNGSTKLYTGPIKIKETTTVNYIAVLPGICESYESTDSGRNTYSRVTIEIEPGSEQYDITIGQMPHGQIKADKTIASVGEVVNLTVIPEEEYELKEGSLMVNGKPISQNQFTMPAEDVTITAEFELIDDEAPQILGVKDGESYCEEQTVTVQDEYLKSVMVDGKTITLDDDHSFILKNGKHVIVASDSYGHSTTVTVTIGHEIVKDPAEDPTCEKEGKTEGTHCSRCGKVIVKQEVIQPLGHSFEDGVCKICGAKDPNYVKDETNDDSQKTEEEKTEEKQEVETAQSNEVGFWCSAFLATAGLVIWMRKMRKQH